MLYHVKMIALHRSCKLDGCLYARSRPFISFTGFWFLLFWKYCHSTSSSDLIKLQLKTILRCYPKNHNICELCLLAWFESHHLFYWSLDCWVLYHSWLNGGKNWDDIHLAQARTARSASLPVFYHRLQSCDISFVV